MENETKPCRYRGCENLILAGNDSEYCEVCRTVVLANAFRYCQDPCAMILDRREAVFANAVHLMTPEDILRAIERTEWVYLNLQKAAIEKKLDIHRRKQFEEGIAATRSESAPKSARAPKVKTETRKKETKKDKLVKLVGREAADQMMADDFGGM